MSEERVFIGTGKEKMFKYGPIIEMTIDVDSIIREYGNHGFNTDQGKRKLRIKAAARREADQFGNTHFVEVETWHPDHYIPPGPIYTGGQISDYQNQENKPAEENKFSSYKPNAPKADDFSSYTGTGAGIPDDDLPF